MSILCLSCLSFLEAGKVKILAEGCAPLLCERLKDQSELAREYSTLVLASLAQMKQGKIEILGSWNEIKRMLEEEKEEKILLNLIELIGSLAEHPEGRILAGDCLDLMAYLGEREYLKPYVADTVGVITWKP